MSCKIIRDPITNEIISVAAPNGKPSNLFKSLLSVFNDKEKALTTWAQAYMPQFLLKHGDWEQFERVQRVDPANEYLIGELSPTITVKLDSNGEPLMQYLELPSVVEPQENQALKDKIENFLQSIGVNIQTVTRLPYGAAAQADLLNRIIKVVKGQQDVSTLPEEAAHFFVELLPPDSALLGDMLNDITSMPIYKEVLANYGNNPDYRTGGKPNFMKLKKEAIGKAIAMEMLGEPVGKKAWFKRLWDIVTNLFKRNPLNPFATAAENILSSQIEGLRDRPTSDISIMYQLGSGTTPEAAFDSLNMVSGQIERKPSLTIDKETGKPIVKYFLDGKEIGKRVTNLVKTFYEKTFGSGTQKANPKREIYNLQAEKGTDIHKDIENIIQRMLTKEGKLKEMGPRTEPIFTNETIYSTLEKHLEERLNNLVTQYGTATRFMQEVMVHDPAKDIAGTVDLIVIKPNGRVDVYDWKSSDFNSGKLTDGVPWWKEEAYTIQLDEYARILKDAYGIETDLKRAIPIRAIFSKDPKSGKYTALTDIEVGSSVVSTIPDDKQYLLPVPSRTEQTGIREIDNLLDRLRSLYDEIKDRKVSLDEKYVKSQELEKIKTAIRSVQSKQSLNGLVENGQLLVNNITKALDADTLTIATAQTYYKELLLYADITKIMGVMEANDYGDKLKEDQKNIVYRLFDQSSNLEVRLKQYLLNGANEIASSQGIPDVTNTERNLGWWKSLVRSVSNATNATVNTFYKYLTGYQQEINEYRDQNNDTLRELQKGLKFWASAKGISNDKAFDGILEIDNKGRWNGGFIYKYSKEFRDRKKAAIDNKDANSTRELEALLDLSPEAKAEFEKRLAKFKKWLDDTEFSLDAEKNTKLKAKKLEDWNYRNNVFDAKYKEVALFNYNNGVKGKDSFLSPKWKELQKPENKPLKDVYDYFQSLLNRADRELGMIDNSGRFIPNIENDKMDMWAQYGASSIFNTKGFFESFEYKTNNTFGEIDPITGKPKKSVPKLFLNNLGKVSKDEVSGEEYTDYSLKSKDLFTVFSLWGKHMAEYEYMSKLEEIGHLMLTVETVKGKHLEKGPDGRYIEVTGNQKNFEFLEDFVNYYVYGQTLKDSNVWEFNLFGKKYSGKKLVQGGLRYMAMKTLAFNTLSIAANYTGGKFNTFFVASKDKFFNKKQWAHGEYALHTDVGKSLINYFDVFLEDETYRRAKQLSMFESVKKISYDNLFIGQRATDQLVQYPVLLAMTKSYAVINGEIVNIKEYAQNQAGYSNIYNLPVEQQKALQQKVEENMAALEEKSIWNLAKIENGKIVIEGIDRNSPTVMNFRLQVKKANKSILGNSTSEDISRYRMSLIGQALGQFRNWMPPMIDERFGELRYNVDIEGWSQGKAISFYNNYFAQSASNHSKGKAALEILSKHVGALVKDIIGFTSDKDIQSRAKALYAKAKADAIGKGLPFDISEHQFIELHYQNLKSMLIELRVILTFAALIFALSMSWDDKDKDNGIARYLTRMFDKFNDELLFYYVPTNFTSLIKSPFPLISLAEDIAKFFQALAGQGYAEIINDEDLKQKYKPTRYILKDIPIAKEIYTLGTIFNEDMRKAYEVTQ